jgi:hypothetical protein
MYDELFTFTDEWENEFKCVNNHITLQLRSEPHRKPRQIGEIVNIKGLIILKKNEKEKHIWRKTRAWSVPVEIFEKIDGMWFISELHSYKILTKKAKENMDYLTFSKSGYEKKVYIPLNIWSTR